MLSVIFELFRDYRINRQHKMDAGFLSFLHQLTRKFYLVVLYERVAYGESFRLVKRVGHAPAYNDGVNFCDKIFNHTNLVRYFRSAKNCHKRTAWAVYTIFQVLDLFLEQKPGDRWLKILSYSGNRSVCTVAASKRIVYKKVGMRGKLHGKLRFILFLFRVEPHIFKQNNFALFCAFYRLFSFFSNAVFCKVYRYIHKCGQMIGYGLQAKFR